jgi:hypothetical protein
MTKGDEPPKLTPALIEELKNRINPATGRFYSQSDIADMFGVTRQHVSWVKHQTDGYSRTLREQVLATFPWGDEAKPFSKAHAARMLRDHAEYMVNGGQYWPEYRRARLLRWYRRLRDEGLVVVFNAEIPPSEGNRLGGYAYQPREERDGELIVRVDEPAELSEQAVVIWRFPPELPDDA